MSDPQENGGDSVAGAFTRDARYIATRITADGRDGFPVEARRYRLVAARACPWHYYEVHRGINPTGVVPAGPDLSGWLTEHAREQLGGRPFGDGSAPGPVPPGERVPPGSNPLVPA